MKKYRVGIVGATGAVGQEIIRLLESRDFPVSEVRLLASERSAGREYEVCGNLETVRETTPEAFDSLDFAIFSAASMISKQFVDLARKRGCVVIDNSSAFRMEGTVPLVVPEINPMAAERHKGVLANPNCTTAVTLMALYPLHKRFGLKSFFASTYQAVSGSGKKGMNELIEQSHAYFDQKKINNCYEKSKIHRDEKRLKRRLSSFE